MYTCPFFLYLSLMRNKNERQSLDQNCYHDAIITVDTPFTKHVQYINYAVRYY